MLQNQSDILSLGSDQGYFCGVELLRPLTLDGGISYIWKDVFFTVALVISEIFHVLEPWDVNEILDPQHGKA
jgi:hypothetical protein